MKVEESDFNALYHFFSSSATLETEVFNKMCSHLKKKQFLKGEPILRAGEIETKSSLVTKGIVHQFIFDDDVAITTNITPQGLPFNSLKSYIEGSPSLEIQEAITDVEIIYLEKKDMELLAQENHQVSYLLYKIHENILLDRENRMLLLQYRNPQKRFRLFHEIVERSNWILDGTPDKYIASYLNMTPQQYSKEKRLFCM
ncbi:Crp/Fnr family transcriptional regulator [Plebeiibacterium sediminum]|uniref:Crp/Fnr family transcriptional regulator n=1 Tax=Plebeiibacterium sediminum TaxID=2992112 RepID=A0AAE3SGX3_9BACT|nr:Crp/Fnr family transcriptional regulator [Plebeiobacterium sediminum]MCW3788955.1 Crp/Fnr family transcriptional regulator [Plebeiobacterium sediminum]